MKLITRKFCLKNNTNSEDSNSGNSMEWLVSGVDFDTRTLELRSEINEMSASFIIRNLIKMNSISHDPITIYFSSPGGDVNQGLAIYDFIKSSPSQINIIASGQIMSMGFIIFLAGHNRIATPNTTFMMHSISYGNSDPKIVKHHEVDVNEAKRLNDVLLNIMGERTYRNKKYWYRTVILQDRFFNVTQAKELGIIKENPVVKKKVIKKTAKNVQKKRKKNVKKKV